MLQFNQAPSGSWFHSVETPLTEYCIQLHAGEFIVVAHSAIASIDGILYIGASWERASALFNELTSV